MKPSPLQLEWLIYPAASFRARELDDTAAIDVAAIKVTAHVTYRLDAPHSVELTLCSDDDAAQNTPYTFAIEAVAAFTFDLAQARAAYGNTPLPQLPHVIAVNVARMVYSAARELLASFTARAPHGSALLASVLIGPEDVQISSVEPQATVLQGLFGVGVSTPAKKTARQPAKHKSTSKSKQ
jgi:hypothetical protein